MNQTYELEIEGHKLAILKLNDQTEGRPVILLHGIGHSIQAWSTDEVFRTYGPCYAISLPAHYPAVAPWEFFQSPLNAEKMVSPLAGAIRQLAGDQPVIVAGLSTGGFGALAIAALYPDLVAGVVCLAGFAQGRWIGLFGLYQAMARNAAGRFFMRNLSRLTQSSRSMLKMAFRTGVADARSLKTYLPFEQLVTNMFPNFQKLEIETMIYFFQQFPKVDITPLLSQIQAPTLVVAGDQDGVVPPAQAAWIASHVPNSQLVMMHGVGHILFIERPVQYEKIIRQWFTENM